MNAPAIARHVTGNRVEIDGETWIRAYGGEIRQRGRRFRTTVAVKVDGYHRGYAPSARVFTVQPCGCKAEGIWIFGPMPVWVLEAPSC